MSPSRASSGVRRGPSETSKNCPIDRKNVDEQNQDSVERSTPRRDDIVWNNHCRPQSSNNGLRNTESREVKIRHADETTRKPQGRWILFFQMFRHMGRCTLDYK